jgi:hypothetical protein
MQEVHLMPYAEIFEAFPTELRLPVARLVDALRTEFETRQADTEALHTALQNLAAAQERTEVRLEELAVAQARTEAGIEALRVAQARTETRMEELAQAQAGTETRVAQLSDAVTALAQAQARTETRVAQLSDAVTALAQAQAGTETRVAQLSDAVTALAQAQAGTETRVAQLSDAVTALAQAQARTETTLAALSEAQQRVQDEQTLFRRTFTSQIGGLGSRWGLQTEEAFRDGIRTIVEEVGFTTERFLTWDAGGEVFGHPEQVELDLVIQNGKVIAVEIKSSLDRANTYLFERKVEFYTRHTSRQVDRKVIIAPYADERAKEVARRLKIEICTDVTEFK